jgi:preprotein translocase SecE subunit
VLRPLKRPARFVGRIIYPSYFRNSWKELKQVTWPTLKESRQLTYAVLIFAVVFGATIALVDYGLDKAFKDFLLK